VGHSLEAVRGLRKQQEDEALKSLQQAQAALLEGQAHQLKLETLACEAAARARVEQDARRSYVRRDIAALQADALYVDRLRAAAARAQETAQDHREQVVAPLEARERTAQADFLRAQQSRKVIDKKIEADASLQRQTNARRTADEMGDLALAAFARRAAGRNKSEDE